MDADDDRTVTTRPSGLRERYRRRRDLARANPATDRVWRATVGLVGGVVVVAGIIMIPYPGPGWLVVFTGLAVLATEFERARRVLDHSRARYDRWDAWQRRQHIAVRLLLLAGTCAVVLTTLWFLDVFALTARWFGIDAPWLDSPLEPFA